jgi:hypothetical protein
MYIIKYYIDDIEIKDGMSIKCLYDSVYGDVTLNATALIKNNKLYAKFADNDIQRVDDNFLKIISVNEI